MAKYRYGMKHRGFSIGCQPKGGLLDVRPDPTDTHYDILVYDRQLNPDEVEGYELVCLGKEDK